MSLIAVSPLVGCDRPSDPSSAAGPRTATPVADRDPSPHTFLEQVFARYRYAASYHDRGQVRLRYRSGDRTEQRVAPLQVWYDQQRLYVKAYDVRLWRDRDELLAWIPDPTTDQFDAQVLRAATRPGRPEIESLFRDPILADRVSAGLAGPPPQLEWLFSPEPMQGLFSPAHRMRFLADATIEGRPCRGVEVDADDEQYRFWVDRHHGLIRRVEFPPVAAPPLLAAAPQGLQLSLELTAASFDQPSAVPDIESLPPEPKYVSRFVTLPPPPPPSVLGHRPPPFRAASVDGRYELTERGTEGAVAISLRLPSAGPLAERDWVGPWSQQISAHFQHDLKWFVLSVDGDSEATTASHGLPVLIDHGGHAATALGLSNPGAVIQDATGRIVWHQQNLSPSSLTAMAAIIADLRDGVDVPQRAREQWQALHDDYQRALTAARQFR